MACLLCIFALLIKQLTMIVDNEEEVMKLVLATGISGGNDKPYLEAWKAFCQKRGKRVQVYHVADMMRRHAAETGLKLNERNFLNADPWTLKQTRSAVFTKIAAELQGEVADYDAVVVSTHAFLYKDCFYRVYDRFLTWFRRQFSPNLYITFIDDCRKIHERLSLRPEWQEARSADTIRTKIDYAKILDWQNIEVDTTSGWADDDDKRFFAVATAQTPATLYKLVFHPEIETVYTQMPISHFRKPEDRVMVDGFIARLNKYFSVFNPLSVEIVGALKTNDMNAEAMTIAHHTVHRDLYWFVHYTDISIVLWPGPVPSPGVNHESHQAYRETKDVWTVYLGEEVSPFVPCFCTEFFRSEEEFFAFLDAKYPERKNLNWD